MRIATRLALLLLSASALPSIAQAEDAWVYGMDESDELAADVRDDAWIFDFAEAGGVEGLGKGIVQKKKPQQQQPSQPSQPAQPVPPPPVLVAVVDTGIDLDHSEFTGRIAAGGACFGTAAACKKAAGQGDDNNGHGTHVAGIIGAASDGRGATGVAPNSKLLAVKVLDANGSGAYTAVASGISYASTQGAKVINLSLGGSSSSATLIAPLQQAALTSVIVAAAGNSGTAYAPGYPAAYATQAGIVGSMIIVGSVNNNNQISSFSQTPGTGGCVLGTCYRDVFLVARGENITSTYVGGGYASMSGTSMATPYVSGVAARVFEASPYLTPKQVVSILLTSATDLGAPGVDAVYGRGLVNLTAALAPIGTQTVATSGSSTSGYTGTGSITNAGLSGILAARLRGSSMAQNLIFFDSYGRDYSVNLASAATTPKVSLLPVIEQDGLFRSVSFSGPGYTVSGLVGDVEQNSVAFAGHTASTRTEFADVVITTKLTDDISLSIGRDAALGGRINQVDLASSEAYTGLFMSASALNSPFLSLTSDATFLATSVKLGDGLTFTAGHASSESDAQAMLADDVLTAEEAAGYFAQDTAHLRSAENTAVAMSWQFAEWGTAGINFAQTQEENGFLGTSEQGALALTGDAVTTSVGIGGRFDLGERWTLSASWSRGQTDASPVAGGLFAGSSEIESEAYGIAIAKTGVFGKDDTIGFAISRPLHITGGTATLTASTGVTEDREIIYSSEVMNLSSSTPQTDYEIGYTARLDENLTLQANAMVQQDVGGEAGEMGVAGFVTLKGTW